MTVSMTQLIAQIDAILARDTVARVIAVRSPMWQDWPEVVMRGGRPFQLRWCDSLLGLREALVDWNEAPDPAGVEQGLVLLTPFATPELPDDIAARISKGRVYQPEGWEIVAELFAAREIDARLGRYGWMPQLLLDAATAGPYPPVATGFLDLETAWRVLLERALHLEGARPDAQTLLAWSQRPEAPSDWERLPDAARSDVQTWLEASSGLVGKRVLATLKADRLADALPLGLVCTVIFSSAGTGEAALGHAAIRLERYVNDLHIGASEGQAWAKAATDLIQRYGGEPWRGALDRADRLLQELRIGEFAYLSDILFSGFDQRLVRFAEALQQCLKNLDRQPPSEWAAALAQTARQVQQHALAAHVGQRAEQVQMACRLVQWLQRPAPEFHSVEQAMLWQADEGAFVDWARFRLMGGDDLAGVSSAYAALRGAVSDRRDRLARAFGRWLAADAGGNGTVPARLIPVEAALDRLVAPLAARHPVLLLVMDGLSISIFRELFAQPESLGWTEWVREDLGRALIGLAAFPTITEVSRTSLLCGALKIGGSRQEKAGFAAHPALLAHSHASTPPRLFHKGELAEDGNLAAPVRAAIADSRQRIVGVVYNAVDDHLSGPDQLHPSWRLENLRLLLPLLREARDARRGLIVTADHGHLLEDGTQPVAGSDRDRWRSGGDPRPDYEIALHGSRVVTADGRHPVICLWSERTRYAGRKNGYHGGASLPEVAVPMSVLLPLGLSLPGWQPAVPLQPEWWDLSPEGSFLTPPALRGRGLGRGGRKSAAAGQEALFDAEIPAMATAQKSVEHWIDALLGSAVYASQRQLAARVALPDPQLRALLLALAQRGGKLSRTALARHLAVPEMRLSGILSAVRRVLNVDQAPVVQVDETAGTIELNQALLIKQFRLEA